MNNEKLAFVCYPSFLDAIEKLPTEELKEQAALALIRCGINGTTEHENLYINMLLTIAAPNIDAAKSRYTIALKNGKKGGRPVTVDKDKISTMLNEGYSKEDIADTCGCSPDYVRKLNNEINTDTDTNTNTNTDTDINNNIDTDTDTNNNNNNNINKNNNINRGGYSGYSVFPIGKNTGDENSEVKSNCYRGADGVLHGVR
jgi:hypothetical protein